MSDETSRKARPGTINHTFSHSPAAELAVIVVDPAELRRRGLLEINHIMASGKDMAQDVARRLGVKLFEAQHYGNSGEHCERQLIGRTHYFDKSTRSYFGSRVCDVQTHCDDLVLAVVESVKPPHGGRVYRAVIFDMLGSILFRTEKQDDSFGHKSAATARKELASEVAKLDTKSEAKRVIAEAIKRNRRELLQLRGAS